MDLLNANTAGKRTEKRKKHSGFAQLSAKINGGTVKGLRTANICIRIVKITSMEIGENG